VVEKRKTLLQCCISASHIYSANDPKGLAGAYKTHYNLTCISFTYYPSIEQFFKETEKGASNRREI
jgi:hypothetical protein